ncbi:MAG TPA: prenyltransferase/squalene oxidase repeat-containing protein [Fimbriiglobus sp.]|jgi:squalene-hopene/tetraprenyl-beta-curcumene cyclase
MKRAILAILLLPTPVVAAPPTKAEWQAVVDKAAVYLKTKQAEDGSWGPAPRNRGITGVVVTGLLKCGVAPSDEPVAKGLKYIESLINPKAGHIAGNDAQAGLINYTTSINVMALTAAGQEDKYKSVVANAAKYLKSYQWDDARGKGPDSDYYGGAGYAGDKSRPDLSNTAFFLEALKAAGVPQDDPAFTKAAVFVSRCQNFASEHNKAAWAAKTNDGSFIYTGANNGENRRSGDTRADLAGYGSMTYAGVKSLIYCGVAKDDPRVKKALEWIGKHYSLDGNPGMPEANAQRGLYYYYHTFAKAMAALGSDTFTDAAGVKHNWRTDLFEAIQKRQNPDGSFLNKNAGWMENDTTLDTGYVLMALSYCKPK